MGLMNGYRRDVFSARRGGVAEQENPPHPTRAAAFVGGQIGAFFAGWVVFFLGVFASCLATVWPPIRQYVVDKTQ
eukprot:159694-Hanusia_phi.AAC.1